MLHYSGTLRHQTKSCEKDVCRVLFSIWSQFKLSHPRSSSVAMPAVLGGDGAHDSEHVGIDVAAPGRRASQALRPIGPIGTAPPGPTPTRLPAPSPPAPAQADTAPPAQTDVAADHCPIQQDSGKQPSNDTEASEQDGVAAAMISDDQCSSDPQTRKRSSSRGMRLL